MNIGDLLRERDRLLGVIEEAKSARSKLKQINILVTMYGDAEHVELVASSNGHGERKPRKDAAGTPKEQLFCDECDGGPFNGASGLAMHRHRVHTGRVTPRKAKAKK